MVDLDIESLGDDVKRVALFDFVVSGRGLGLLVVGSGLEKKRLPHLQVATSQIIPALKITNRNPLRLGDAPEIVALANPIGARSWLTSGNGVQKFL